jgi:hypothetical protein
MDRCTKTLNTPDLCNEWPAYPFPATSHLLFQNEKIGLPDFPKPTLALAKSIQGTLNLFRREIRP